MMTDQSEKNDISEIRAALLRELRGHATASFVAICEELAASDEDIRDYIEAAKEQRKYYEDAGFTDMSKGKR